MKRHSSVSHSLFTDCSRQGKWDEHLRHPNRSFYHSSSVIEHNLASSILPLPFLYTLTSLSLSVIPLVVLLCCICNGVVGSVVWSWWVSGRQKRDKEETDDFYSLLRAREGVNVPFAELHRMATPPASQKAVFPINCRQPFDSFSYSGRHACLGNLGMPICMFHFIFWSIQLICPSSQSEQKCFFSCLADQLYSDLLV